MYVKKNMTLYIIEKYENSNKNGLGDYINIITVYYYVYRKFTS